MICGYIRTSTLDQVAGLEAQDRDLRAAGVERIFTEQASAIGERPQLEAALDFLREGDVLVVTKLDRLARSVTHLGQIVERLEGKGVALRILALGVDTATPTGRLVLNIMGAIAQFEVAMMKERQREGIAKAKADGKYRGRVPTARTRTAEVLALREQNMTLDAIARQLRLGKGSVHRILANSGQSRAGFRGQTRADGIGPE